MRFSTRLKQVLQRAVMLSAVTAPLVSQLPAANAATTPYPSNGNLTPGQLGAKWTQIRQKVNHVIVIYQENWSFDSLYGKFPGANGLANADATSRQVDKNGNVYFTLPQNDPHLPPYLPNAPFDLTRYVPPQEQTRDLIHRFYHEQLQIDAGRMDKFVAWSDAQGLAMSYYDATNLPEGKLAQQYTMADNFFHAAFGGSFLNHMWLIAARTPVWVGQPAKLTSNPDPNNLNDNNVTPDAYVVNTSFSVYQPHPANITDPNQLVPPQTFPTIGDRLSAKNLPWAWYAGGWNAALAGNPDPLFQFHHQPFVYFKNYADGTAAKAQHLKDEADFFTALQGNNLPAVSFIKPLGPDNEHPGYTNLVRGQQHVADLVGKIQASPYWKDSMIVITYDENGGRWDHVPPPVVDRWGPGTRVPTIIISPFARKGFVDHTQYDTTSILKFIERRWLLPALNTRDAFANDLSNSLTFDATPGNPTPTISNSAASVANGNIKLAFSAALNADLSSDASHYTVTVNGHTVAVDSASYNGITHTVTLSLPAGSFKVGDQIGVAWHGLSDANGTSFDGQSGNMTAR